jgi:hypothetical protein
MIHQPLTVAELRGPTGPFLLEVRLTDPVAPASRRWQFQQSVRDLEEGLRVASRMSQAYQYRLFLGAAHGHLYLDWQDDEGADTCSPVWVRRS